MTEYCCEKFKEAIDKDAICGIDDEISRHAIETAQPDPLGIDEHEWMDIDYCPFCGKKLS